MLVTSGLLYAIVPKGPSMACGWYLVLVHHALQVGGLAISGKNLDKMIIGLANVFRGARWARHNFFLRQLV